MTADLDGGPILPDPGSFRDPGGRVFERGGRIFRAVMPAAAAAYRSFRDSGLLDRFTEASQLVSSREAAEKLPGFDAADIVLEHDRIPFISYPYEWSFALHRRAALLHLDLQIEALRHDFMLSDATAYNVQFRGNRPIFIDHLSFRPYVEGEPWIGHRQFCMQFLNPLLLRSRLGVAPNAWFRGSLEGIAPEDLAPLLRWRDNLSWTVLSHVTMQAALQRKTTARNLTGRAARTRIPRRHVEAILLGLRHFIDGARLPKRQSVWKQYAADNSYAPAEAEAKHAFVARMVSQTKPGMLVDLGCNSGDYSITALDAGASRVIGFDFDLEAIEMACLRPEAQGRDFLPLWLDAANPSPDQGWAQRERRGLAGRLAGADAVIALAFVHHLAIGRNVPLDDVVGWIMAVAPRGIIEFPMKSDPMVQLLLAQRPDIFPDYNAEAFLASVRSRARIVDQASNREGHRLMLWFDRAS